MMLTGVECVSIHKYGSGTESILRVNSCEFSFREILSAVPFPSKVKKMFFMASLMIFFFR